MAENYIIGGMNAANPTQAIAQGYQLGAGIRDDQQAQAQRQLAQQQQQAALQQQQELQAAYAQVAANPNPSAQDYSRLMLLDPKSAEATKKAWELRNTDQQQALAGDLGAIGSALQKGQPQVAHDYLVQQADAMEASRGGPSQESQSKRDLAKIALDNPQFALGKVYALLNSNDAGKQVASGLLALNTDQRAEDLQPAAVKEATAKAATAQVGAGVAVATAPDAIAAPGLKNQQTQQEIASAQVSDQIKQLDVQISQANSETQRGQLQLERDKLVQQQTQKQQEQGQSVQSSIDGANQALDTVKSVLAHPGLSDVVGKIGGASFNAKIPGSNAADFSALVDTLKSQQFLANVKNLAGMGALSDTEGKKIADATASLSFDQSQGSFKTALKVIQSTLQRAVNKNIASPNVPTSGGGFVMAVPKYGAVSEGDINRLLQQHPGSTRDQVLQFLQSQAK